MKVKSVRFLVGQVVDLPGGSRHSTANGASSQYFDIDYNPERGVFRIAKAGDSALPPVFVPQTACVSWVIEEPPPAPTKGAKQ